jgi:hypothetical protein
MKTVEGTAIWRCLGTVFLVVIVPVYHAVGGFFFLHYLMSSAYTWGATLRTFVLLLSNLVLAYEFVYRDLQISHPGRSSGLLMNDVIRYSVIPFSIGMAALMAFRVVGYLPA